MQDRKQLIDSKENNNLFSCCECEIEHFFHKYRRVSLIKKSYPTFKRSSSNEHTSFFSLPQLPIVKVVDILLRNPLAPLGQTPGDCNNPSVR